MWFNSVGKLMDKHPTTYYTMILFLLYIFPLPIQWGWIKYVYVSEFTTYQSDLSCCSSDFCFSLIGKCTHQFIKLNTFSKVPSSNIIYPYICNHWSLMTSNLQASHWDNDIKISPQVNAVVWWGTVLLFSVGPQGAAVTPTAALLWNLCSSLSHCSTAAM